jgi:hypothetical protein
MRIGWEREEGRVVDADLVVPVAKTTVISFVFAIEAEAVNPVWVLRFGVLGVELLEKSWRGLNDRRRDGADFSGWNDFLGARIIACWFASSIGEYVSDKSIMGSSSSAGSSWRLVTIPDSTSSGGETSFRSRDSLFSPWRKMGEAACSFTNIAVLTSLGTVRGNPWVQSAVFSAPGIRVGMLSQDMLLRENWACESDMRNELGSDMPENRWVEKLRDSKAVVCGRMNMLTLLLPEFDSNGVETSDGTSGRTKSKAGGSMSCGRGGVSASGTSWLMIEPCRLFRLGLRRETVARFQGTFSAIKWEEE